MCGIREATCSTFETSPELFAYSADSGPLIPKEVGRLFRLKAATYSDPFRPPCRSEATLGFLILTDSSVVVKFLFLSHRSSFELNSVSIVNQPVHDGVGDGWVSDMIMPMISGKLASDEGGGATRSVFDHFQ